MSITLTTDRLTLRPYHRSDFDSYAALMASDRAVYMGGPFDRDTAWQYFATDAAAATLTGHGCFMLSQAGTCMGFAGVIHPPHFPEPEMGWALYDGHEGQGFASEASRAILDHMFATTDCDSFVSYIDPDNAASIAVATRLGGQRDLAAQCPDGWNSLVYRHTPQGAAA